MLKFARMLKQYYSSARFRSSARLFFSLLFLSRSVFAAQPDFSMGSSLLDKVLRESHFQVLFTNNMFVGDTVFSQYRFVISSNGLLCPQRIMLEKGPFEFFSNSIANAGCLNLQDLVTSSSANAGFKSENNPIMAESRGVLEGPGKEYNLFATRQGPSVDLEFGEPMIISLKIGGKTHITKWVDVWVSGGTEFRIRVQKNTASQIWNIAFGGMSSEAGNGWRPFTFVKSVIARKTLLAGGFSIAFGNAGSAKHPLNVTAAKVEFK